MEQQQLNEALEKHRKWLADKKDGQRADLRDANLRGTNLRGANLRGANLRDANLRYADLRDANLRNANLKDANLKDANLGDANLRGADLKDANLRDADLRYADLRDAELPSFQIPQDGEITVWKKCSNGIAKLLIPSDAKRTASLVGRKCRCEYAKVIECIRDGENVKEIEGWKYKNFKYNVGEYVYPDRYNDDIRLECTNGIHFFLTREEAEAW